MQELVEVIRRDHAVLHDQVRESDPQVERAIEAHLAFLDQCVAPAIEELGPQAASDWSVAREALLNARELVGSPGASRDRVGELAEIVRGHAEQMEQVVLPRLVGQLDEERLSDLTARALEHHGELPLSDGAPVGIRSELTESGPDSSRPAGADPL